MLVLCIAVSVSEAQSSTKSNVSDTGQRRLFGAYVGFEAGGQFTRSQVHVLTSGAAFTTTGLEHNGLIGGIQFGYGRALGRVYIGGEVDSNFGRFVSGHVQFAEDGGLSNAYVAHRKFVGTARARTGFLLERWLFYGTGGLAAGRLEQDMSFSGPGAVNLMRIKVEHEGVELGYGVGGGAEYRASRRLSYVVQSDYYRFQNQTLNIAAASGPGFHGSGVNPTMKGRSWMI